MEETRIIVLGTTKRKMIASNRILSQLEHYFYDERIVAHLSTAAVAGPA